jgi:hypothetical protein
MVASVGTTSEVEYMALENHIHTLALAYLERRNHNTKYVLKCIRIYIKQPYLVDTKQFNL